MRDMTVEIDCGHWVIVQDGQVRPNLGHFVTEEQAEARIKQIEEGKL